MNQSAVRILHLMRKKHERNAKTIRLFATILVFMLAIDLAVIVFVKMETMNLIAWGGLAGLILALGVAMKEMLNAKDWVHTIDHFYLSLTKRLEDGNKTKTK